ncbi:MAG: hypothetical protein MUE30_00795 [Spirosomaceae bacterium]|nr:hypothetical protein [Spirosomataceae bacterium]
MKQPFNVLLSVVALFLVSISGVAQDYHTAVGLRAGGPNGVTIKHFTKPKMAVEGIISSRWRGLGFTGLVEGHARFLGVKRLHFIYGAGGHIYFWGDSRRGYSPSGRSSVVGIDGILGLEYNFKEIPINLSLDWKPYANLHTDFGFWGDEGGISVRYMF